MKPFFTYEQQLEKLKASNLIIDDEISALSYLRSEGYYNLINGYAHSFKSKSGYIAGTKFEHILALYRFDKDIRNVIYKYTSTIECTIKAAVAHEFSRVHGVDENRYLSEDCFVADGQNEDNVKRLIEECRKIITEATDKNSDRYREYIAHSFKSHNHVPLWILIRAMTFGATTIFYRYMLQAEKESIAANYHVSGAQLSNILKIVVSFRNIVAHGERTFCAKLPRSRLAANQITNNLNIDKNENGRNKHGNNDILALIICCKYLLSPIDFVSMIAEINSALTNLTEIIGPSNTGRIRNEMGLKKSYINDLLHKNFFETKTSV